MVDKNRKIAAEFVTSFINGNRNSVFAELKAMKTEKTIYVSLLMLKRFKKISTKKNNYAQDFLQYVAYMAE
jgi:hypothetical protein